MLDWGQQLGWSAPKVQALALEYEPQRAGLSSANLGYQDALRMLGVEAHAEPGQIKQAYRRLVSRHHPDKLVGSGASPSQVREATERTRELHQAYAIIRQRRGF
ncbi:DnaJ-like protein DjlA [compost metagenome]